METSFSKFGYQFNSSTHVWSKSSYAGISYSDGDEIEQRIASIIKGAADISVLSTELRQHINDWPSLYHLSSTRANILRPFHGILAGADVLEIGAGCGAITRYLGESGANVLALEGSPRRAAIARSRTRDLSNVEVITDSFEKFDWDRKFDVITLIGVLEYANMFVPGTNPALSMLCRARSMLKPDGKLIIAIENQLGLKYFAGAPEDHLEQPMYGIEARYRSDQPETYGRKSLEAMLIQAGFKTTDFLAPFPDYKLPVSIVTESGFDCDDFDAGALAWQSVRRDPQLPQYLGFSPELVWPTLTKNKIALDLANSFLVVAGNDSATHVEPSVLAYHFSTERASCFCKETRFLWMEKGAVEINYHLLSTGVSSFSGNNQIKFTPLQKANYVLGKTLSWELVQIVIRDGWHIEEVGAFLKRYLSLIASLAGSENNLISIDSIQTPLPGKYFDLVPQNIIAANDGRFEVIDTEWVLNKEIPAGWLVFRALLLLVQTVTRFGFTASPFEDTRMGFFKAAFQSAGLKVNEGDLVRFGHMEAEIQAEVQQRSVSEFQNWWSDSALPKNSLHTQIANLNQEIREREREHIDAIALLNHNVAERDKAIEEIFNSTSWRITAPLRFATAKAREARRAVPSLQSIHALIAIWPQILSEKGGWRPVLDKTVSIFRHEGLAGLRQRAIKFVTRQQNIEFVPAGLVRQTKTKLPTIPYYINPALDSSDTVDHVKANIAVHLYLYSSQTLKECAAFLNNIPLQYDIYVSMPSSSNSDEGRIQEQLRQQLNKANNIVIAKVPDLGQDISSLIIQFGVRLSQYEIIAHIHNKGDVQNSNGVNWFQNDLTKLMGPANSSGGRIAHIIDLLQTTAKIVLPESPMSIGTDQAGWSVLDIFKEKILEKHSNYSFEKLQNIELTENSMFWAQTKSLKDLFGLSLEYKDFPADLVAGARMRGFEQILLLLADKHQGQSICIHTGDSIKDYREYEEQQDYSNKIAYSDIKVLSYYLPQFHPIPENDEWHGKGFTEWTKVSAANPLFEGHYQQHIPHEDIGYYQFDSAEPLRRQADQMKKSGVYGQVFYHYWFTGKLILEKPAQLLLNTPDIQMPFCFCWANENWTRRWDGNEKEILLGQNYSQQDAHDFIHYLIPFFKDPRYIKVDNRPVLYVYRPSSIPNPQEYLDIWEAECKKNGIGSPYVVAVLTRGATHPKDFSMDAATERVLHDWTDGAVPDIKHTLRPYRPFNGRALSYSDVARFYMEQKDVKDFTYFRSLVPIWDNTARYGSEAYVVHGSTPQRFQEWMESLIEYTQSTLPSDRRFILVNAWNEWAEGAHLEPDTRYGYSYLNSVGRALSGIRYGEEFNDEAPLNIGTKVHLSFSNKILDELQTDSLLRQRFMHCLSRSSIFKNCSVSIDAPELLACLPSAMLAAADDADFIVEFRRAAYFDPAVLEKMVGMSYTTGSSVIANNYDDNSPLIEISKNGSVDTDKDFEAPLIVIPGTVRRQSKYRNFRMRTDARSFSAYPSQRLHADKPVVTTIIRFHKSGNFDELKNVLYCLYAMRDCVVIPLIAAQDLSNEQVDVLNKMFEDFAWVVGCEPQVHLYQSPGGKGDLRSKMLNASLKQVKSRYAAFLDFDDLLMPGAYDWLIRRLEGTGKAVSFGRVYSTSYDSKANLLLERTRAFEYGYSYQEYVQHNHAPLHSFMLDMEKLDLQNIIYFDDHRYMEDYLLTLQIFTEENADWASLKENHYIGDYIHSIDRSHTLALTDDQIRKSMFSNPEYILCEERIKSMRKSIAKQGAKQLPSAVEA